MVDIEAEVYDRCAKAVLEIEPEAFTTSTYVAAPASFPALHVSEISNVTDTRHMDSALKEKFSIVTYQSDVYSNLRSGAKRQAKKMAQAVDEAMLAMGLTRTYMGTVSNPADTSVYRISARYTAVAGDDKRIYRR